MYSSLSPALITGIFLVLSKFERSKLLRARGVFRTARGQGEPASQLGNSWARFTNSGLSPSSLMNLAKSIPPIDLDRVHEVKTSQLNN